MMSKYTSLTADYRLHFKKLIDNKPDLKVGGEEVHWEVLIRNVKTLSEPAELVNHEKLPMRRGLSTYMVEKDNGKTLVANRIRENNAVVFFHLFPYLELPVWFDRNFDVVAAVDRLFGLRIFNFTSGL